MPIYGFDETKSKFPVLDKATYDPAGKSGQIAVINDIKPVVLTDDATVNPLIPTLYVMNAASKTITLGTNVNAGIEVIIFAKIATTVSYIVNGVTVTDSLSADDTIGYIFNGLNWTRKNKIVYSTSEVKTGDYWIDGKPIYRKSWNVSGSAFTRTVSSSRVLYTLTDTNGLLVSNDCDELIDCHGYWLTIYNYSGGYRNRRIPLLGSAMNSNGTTQICSLVDYYDYLHAVFLFFQHTDGLAFYTPAISKVTMTVYYTKTTD